MFDGVPFSRGEAFKKHMVEAAIHDMTREDRIVWQLRHIKRIQLDIIPAAQRTPNQGRWIRQYDRHYPQGIEEARQALVNILKHRHHAHNPIAANQAITYDWRTNATLLAQLDANELAAKQKTQSEKRELAPEGRVLMTFSDGVIWVDLGRSSCNKEGEAMQHCGNAGGDPMQTIYSCRIPCGNGKYKPIMTFIMNTETDRLGEMKGRFNQKPDPAYHQYILPLLMSERVKGIDGGGYLPENNFSLTDLDKTEMQAAFKRKPALLDLQNAYAIDDSVNSYVLAILKPLEEQTHDWSYVQYRDGVFHYTFNNLEEVISQFTSLYENASLCEAINRLAHDEYDDDTFSPLDYRDVDSLLDDIHENPSAVSQLYQLLFDLKLQGHFKPGETIEQIIHDPEKLWDLDPVKECFQEIINRNKSKQNRAMDQGIVQKRTNQMANSLDIDVNIFESPNNDFTQPIEFDVSADLVIEVIDAYYSTAPQPLDLVEQFEDAFIEGYQLSTNEWEYLEDPQLMTDALSEVLPICQRPIAIHWGRADTETELAVDGERLVAHLPTTMRGVSTKQILNHLTQFVNLGDRAKAWSDLPEKIIKAASFLGLLSDRTSDLTDWGEVLVSQHQLSQSRRFNAKPVQALDFGF